MTLEEAIKVEQDNHDFFKQQGFPECAEASRLGREALEAISKYRQRPNYQFLKELPGETRD